MVNIQNLVFWRRALESLTFRGPTFCGTGWEDGSPQFGKSWFTSPVSLGHCLFETAHWDESRRIKDNSNKALRSQNHSKISRKTRYEFSQQDLIQEWKWSEKSKVIFSIKKRTSSPQHTTDRPPTGHVAVLVLLEVSVQVGLLTETPVAQVTLEGLLLVVDVADMPLQVGRYAKGSVAVFASAKETRRGL